MLALAWLLRIDLASRGGQLSWPDEIRYARSQNLVADLGKGDIAGALDIINSSLDHGGFVFVGAIPAALHNALAGAFRLRVADSLWVPAAVLSLTSVLSIGLVYGIARRTGAGEIESFTAALLMACATTMFFYARHLLPYDSAMMLALLALWLGLVPRPGILRMLICGLCAGAAFLTYNGYWLITFFVALVLICYHVSTIRDLFFRAIAFGIGALSPLLALNLLSLSLGDTPYIVRMLGFGLTINQGDFSEGATLPWEYFWHAEHFLLLVWFFAALVILWLTFREGRVRLSRGLMWLGVAAAMYVLMIILSRLELFVVYGRLARQMTPFLSLAAAYALAVLGSELPSRFIWQIAAVGGALLLAQAAFNFGAPLQLEFFDTVLRRTLAITPVFAREITVTGPPIIDDDPHPDARYVLLNAQNLFPASGKKAPPNGRVIFEVEHPLEYLPYQYEGFDARGRRILRSAGISVRLIDTQTSP